MNESMEEILEKYYPPSSVNNSRAIIRKKIESFNKNPSESKAQELENLGFTADFSNKDHGEPPTNYERLN